MSNRLTLKAGEVRKIPLAELAALFRQSLNAASTPQAIASTLGGIKTSLERGDLLQFSCVDVFDQNPTRINFSDWSSFDLNPGFEGAVPTLVMKSARVPVGAAINYNALYIGMPADEAETFMAAVMFMMMTGGELPDDDE